MKPLWITPLIFLPSGLSCFRQQPASNKSRFSVGLIHFQPRYSIVSKQEYWFLEGSGSYHLSQRAHEVGMERTLKMPGNRCRVLESAQTPSYAFLLVPTVTPMR